MEGIQSAERRLRTIMKLAEEYFVMPSKALIEKYDERLRYFDVRGSSRMHPHKGKRLYITRRSLKHFVERRKEDLTKRHSEDDALVILLTCLRLVRETVINFDAYEHDAVDGTYSFTTAAGGSVVRALRVVTELAAHDDALEIVSIHITKPRRRALESKKPRTFMTELF